MLGQVEVQASEEGALSIFRSGEGGKGDGAGVAVRRVFAVPEFIARVLIGGRVVDDAPGRFEILQRLLHRFHGEADGLVHCACG